MAWKRLKKLTSLGENDDVVTTTERIGEVGGRTKEDIRVSSFGLASRGTVKVPFFQVVEGFNRFGESLQFTRMLVGWFE